MSHRVWWYYSEWIGAEMSTRYKNLPVLGVSFGAYLFGVWVKETEQETKGRLSDVF